MKTNLLALLFLLAGCAHRPVQSPGIGRIERLDPALDALVSSTAKVEVITTGMDWSEGPLWLEKQKKLLFSDVPKNTIYQWTEAKGREVYLSPSGYTDTAQRGGETGSNGLLLDASGKLVLCQCGNRQMARMEAPLDKPAPIFTSLAAAYNGKKLNSPNDAVYNSKGELFFTDPPYGLEKYMSDPKKELPFQGVYRVRTNGTVELLLDSITRPNGIAFLPGEKKLLIANSDPRKPYWYIYDVPDNGGLQNGKIFYDAGSSKNLKGLPDGFKVDRNGNVFATGPGGVWIFNSAGKLLGRILVPEATSNCAFSADEKTLFVTNDMNILRIKLRD
ncbi:MAG: SMP-30/gluconolactonase/LRE family protein [Sediminibacterium sp.]|nr:SMP-30/gluconolactonase/LRE family protein [Sediminibacterium sp.]